MNVNHRRFAGPRILLLSASVGAGHMRAAEAIQLALAQICPQAHVEHHDVLEHCNAGFRALYGKSYFRAVAKAPHLVGYLYDRLDRPVYWKRLDKIRSGMQKLNVRKVVDLLTGGSWDLIINTHFLPAEVVASLRNAGRIECPQFTVTTDFDVHRLWAYDPCEHYFTATEEGLENLSRYVPRERISATGIPIHPDFALGLKRVECQKLQGLSTDRPVVLQLAGGFGFGPIETIHRQLLSIDRPVHVVVVAGRNAEAKTCLEAIPLPRHHRRSVMGFTRDMAELMTAADVVVSKPGGLTTSEAIACGTPMAIVDPIPGQESRNSDFLLEAGAAIKANCLTSLGFKLGKLLDDTPRLHRMSQQALTVAKPTAAYDVSAKAMAFIGWSQACEHDLASALDTPRHGTRNFATWHPTRHSTSSQK